jgi:hypothetical protein
LGQAGNGRFLAPRAGVLSALSKVLGITSGWLNRRFADQGTCLAALEGSLREHDVTAPVEVDRAGWITSIAGIQTVRDWQPV